MNRKESYLVGASWRYVLLVCVLLVSSMSVWCVNGSFDEAPKASADETTYDVVEQMPSFPGGINALIEYLSSHIEYPTGVKHVDGRVIVQFVVKKDGSIGDIEVVRPLDPAYDAEVVRVVEAMPKWNPGVQKGEAVNCKFTLPVTFTMQTD